MKIKIGKLISILFMILVLVSLDQHLANYFSGEPNALITADNLPTHCDLPVNSSDHHEDVALRTIYCVIPLPDTFPVNSLIFFHLNIARLSPHTIWQPPEQMA